MLAVIHRVDRRRIGEDGDDRVHARCEFGRRLRNSRACRDRGLGFLGRAIPHRERMAEADEPRRDGAAHAPGAGDADIHVASLAYVTKVDCKPRGCFRMIETAAALGKLAALGRRVRLIEVRAVSYTHLTLPTN